MYWSHGHIQTNTSSFGHCSQVRFLTKEAKFLRSESLGGQRCRILVKALALHQAILSWISGIQEVPGGP